MAQPSRNRIGDSDRRHSISSLSPVTSYKERSSGPSPSPLHLWPKPMRYGRYCPSPILHPFTICQRNGATGSLSRMWHREPGQDHEFNAHGAAWCGSAHSQGE
jgi:hypothetical protein